MHSRLTCVPHTRVCPRHPQALLFTPVAAFLTTRKTSLLYTYRLSHSKTDQAGTERNPDADKPLVGTGLRHPLLLVADRLRSEVRADLPTDPQDQGCRATVGPGGLAHHQAPRRVGRSRGQLRCALVTIWVCRESMTGTLAPQERSAMWGARSGRVATEGS